MFEIEDNLLCSLLKVVLAFELRKQIGYSRAVDDTFGRAPWRALFFSSVSKKEEEEVIVINNNYP